MACCWSEAFLPNNRELATGVWLEMNDQITNYIRGKVIHILVVGAANYVVFAFMGINYALLLGIWLFRADPLYRGCSCDHSGDCGLVPMGLIL